MSEHTTITAPKELRDRLELYAESLSRQGEHVPLYVAIAELLSRVEEETFE